MSLAQGLDPAPSEDPTLLWLELGDPEGRPRLGQEWSWDLGWTPGHPNRRHPHLFREGPGPASCILSVCPVSTAGTTEGEGLWDGGVLSGGG